MSEHRTPIATVHIGTVGSFIAEMRNDAERIRHREVRWATETVTPTDAEPTVTSEMLSAGYLAEHEEHLTLVELRRPCGCVGAEEDIAARESVATALGAIEHAATDRGLTWRQGKFSLDPSPLMPRPIDVLRGLFCSILTMEGTTYVPWTDGWAIGFECRRKDGTSTFLYLNPSGESDEGHGSVFMYSGTGGSPPEDLPLHWYDPFGDSEPLHWYTVRTANGERQWRAVSQQHAREQHGEAFAGEPGEDIIAVMGPFPPEQERAA